MPAGWRYTIGILSVARYTIIPERLFAGFPIPWIGSGGDHYNPYTNTVSIYSGNRSISLHEGGHAKDFSEIEKPALEGRVRGPAVRAVPGHSLRVVAGGRRKQRRAELGPGDRREPRVEIGLSHPSTPAYATYVGGGAADISGFFLPEWWMPYVVQFGTVAVGHVAGQTRALPRGRAVRRPRARARGDERLLRGPCRSGRGGTSGRGGGPRRRKREMRR